MSGGHFNYDQNRIDYIIEAIEEVIEEARYSDATLQEFKNGIRALKIAKVFAQRIDWLLSCDDDEDTFHKRLNLDILDLDWPV